LPAGNCYCNIVCYSPICGKGADTLDGSPGTAEEEAALTWGKRLENLLVHYAPQYKMGAAVRVMLTTARAAGEFGAVSVVSGHIRGLTNTVPLHVEILYNEYKFSAAFAVASLLTSLP